MGAPPDKQIMPRIPRHQTVVPAHPHHVILRGNNRRRLFSYPRERRHFLTSLRKSSIKHGVPVHVLMLMTNHVHLLVTPDGPKQLARFVGAFAQSYSQYRNRARNSSGKLFEQRYTCIPILHEEQMAVTHVYVELNPVRARLCTDAADHRWSTYRLHAGLEEKEALIADLWSPSPWYLSLGRKSMERAAAFRNWFAHYEALDEWSCVHRGPVRSSDRKRFERPDRRRAI